MAGDFTLDFQIRLLAWLAVEPAFGRYLPHVKDEHFETSLLKFLVPIYHSHWKDYHQPPSVLALRNEVQQQPVEFSPEEGAQFNLLCQLIEAKTFPDITYVKDAFTSFIKNRSLLKTLASKESQTFIDKGDWQAFVSTIRAAEPQFRSLTVDQDLFNVDVLSPLFNVKPMMAGIKLIDLHLGGLFRHEMNMFLGNMKSGKSLILTYIGGQLLRQQLKVLHVTLEMSKARVMHRYFATLAEPKDDIRFIDFKTMTRPDHIAYYLDRLEGTYGGKLALVEMPAGTTKVEDVQHIVEQYEPDVLILDYLNLMRASNNYTEERHKLDDIATGVRGISTSCNIHIETASQTNRLAANKKIVEGTDVAENFGLNRIADNIIGIGRSKEQRKLHQVVLNLAAARNDDADIQELYQIDFSHMSLEFVNQEYVPGYSDAE